MPDFPNGRQGSLKTRAIALLSGLVGVSVLVWLLTWGASRHYALLLSTGLLAYGFGLRHAVDADHISAIDNTTRKLMQDGQRPLGVGLFFSLGHSTVVVLLCAALALSTAYVQRHLPALQSTGAVAGTLISSVFLYVIGVINLIVLWDLYRAFRQVAGGGDYADQKVEDFLAQRGLLGRFFRPVLRLIRHSWQMYFVGFLFGLGFDTATEVGILAISARSGQSGVPFGTLMLLPLLFTAGMCLVDTLDGVLMLGAYGWAFVKPIRKLYYNLSITTLSVLVAFVVGTYELLQILQQEFSLRGRFWGAVGRLSFDSLGYVIIGTFLLGWVVSVLVYRLKNYEAA
ncbi:MAG: HoxN/HupN/NixA family nickel/cobalt transporter [Armatimonadetes bacterium]|nr:HoxN/HupN/NixA family nickel/cobalt transporter [Armatimonadota bacterium]